MLINLMDWLRKIVNVVKSVVILQAFREIREIRNGRALLNDNFINSDRQIGLINEYLTLLAYQLHPGPFLIGSCFNCGGPGTHYLHYGAIDFHNLFV